MMKASIEEMKFRPALQQGFTLIELMVAMLIGLIVVAAAGGIFLSNSHVFRTSESVGRIQENIRASFEILSRDIREASATPCGDAQNMQGGGALSRLLRRAACRACRRWRDIDSYMPSRAQSQIIFYFHNVII